MAWTTIRLLSVLILGALAIILASTSGSATSEGLVTYKGRNAGHDVYLWRVGHDEGRRLTALLHHDFADLEMDGTYVTAAPQACSHCGKQTEFADWVYTALERNIHSPEFIAGALKNGTSAKNVYHDVYCSRCGHLTAFRDPFGTEGRAAHIAHAAPYDRTTKTFGKCPAGSGDLLAVEDVPCEASSPPPADAWLWIPSNPWIEKRDADRLSTLRDMMWIPSDPWFRKRDANGLSTLRDMLWIPSDPWFRKRELAASSAQRWIWIPSNPWLRKRDAGANPADA